MTQDNTSKAIGTREAKLAGGLSKAALIAGLVASWTIVGEAIVPTEVAAQEQPPLPPVTIESPTARPRAATQPAARSTAPRAKRAARRTNRNATRANPAPVAATLTSPPPAPPKEGSEAAGYKPETTTNFGPFGSLPILDVPYSVNVVSSDLIENTLAVNPQDALKLSPVVQTTIPATRDLAAPGFDLRGFSAVTISQDGLRTGDTGEPIALEDKERVEIYTGLTSFLFGGTDIGGMVNYVYKRPTDTPLYNLTLGDYGYGAGFVHADLGGPLKFPGIPDGMFSYRLNLVEQHGDLPVSPQSEDRQVVTAVLDWHVTPTTTVEVIGSHQNVDLHGWGGIYIFGANPNGSTKFNYSFVPNPTLTFTAPWTSYNQEDDRGEINLKSKLNDIFTVRLAYSFENDNRAPYYLANNTLTDNVGDYSQLSVDELAQTIQIQSEYAFLDAHFNTWSIEHNLTTGYYGNQYANIEHAGAYPTPTTTGLNFFNGPYYPVSPPGLPPTPATSSYFGKRFLDAAQDQTNFVLGDEIKFNNYVSALVGANYATIDNTNYNTAPPFASSSHVDESKLSPSASLIFKPISWVSTYATYSQGLQAGQAVPNTMLYTNAGQILPPFVSYEYEVGAKADFHGLLLTGALFDINKTNQYAQPNPNGTDTYVQDGRQVHKGIELTATGNLYEGLRILGGVTLMDARVLQTASVTTDNKYPVGVANQMVKSTMEYDLPFLKGLTLTGGVYYVGKQAADALNTQWVPAYVTEDLGFRYKYQLPTGQEAIFRLNVSNLTDHAYWIAPNYVGAPRVVAFSTQFKF